MIHRVSRVVTSCILAASLGLAPHWARADNQMGYRLLTPQDAASLPHNGGGLGLDVERAQEMTDSGMTFDIIGVKQARPGYAGARAGLRHGDEIIAIDGHVFPSLQVFAAYVGSLAPGAQAMVDYIPAGGGPAQAKRVAIAIASRPGRPAPPAQAPGMSTGTKVAIGVGAAALLGCYEMGCFKRGAPQAQPNQGANQGAPAVAQPQ